MLRAQVEEFLRGIGVSFEFDLNESSFQTFESNGIKGWYATDKRSLKSKRDIFVMTVGFWNSTREKHVFKSLTDMTPEESDQAERWLKKTSNQRLEEIGEKHLDAAIFLRKMWDNIDHSLWSITSHEYLIRKGFDMSVHNYAESGLYISSIDKKASLIIPLRDMSGELWNVQYIYEDGRKKFMTGGRVKGLFNTIGCKVSELDSRGKVFVCEGWATGLSIWQGAGVPVVVAFNANNLIEVVRLIRQHHPTVIITNCADDDQWKEMNTGREVAQTLKDKWGIDSLYPIFCKNHEDKVVDKSGVVVTPTDFNDLHLLYGLDEVRRQLSGQVSSPEIVHNISDQQSLVTLSCDSEVTEELKVSIDSRTYPKYTHNFFDIDYPVMELPLSQQGKVMVPPDTTLGEKLAALMGDHLTKYLGDVWYWAGTHWVYVDDNLKGLIRDKISRIVGTGLSSSKLDCIYRETIERIPTAPRSLFQPDTHRVSFANGTLKLHQDISGNYSLIFGAHHPSDLCTHTLPFNFDPQSLHTSAPATPNMDTLLARLWPEADGHNKLLISEIFGAALCPISPKVFLFHGPGSTGKSTLAMILTKLMNPDNVGILSPEEMKGFNLEILLGKTANICTEIGNESISDKVLKEIYDSKPMRVDRKYKQAVIGHLPKLHIFCGNHLFKSQEGNSGAYSRRITFIECKNVIEKEDFSFVNRFVEENKDELIRFALWGLARLLRNRGLFSVTQELKQKVKDWAEDSDVVSSFIKDIGTNEVVLTGQKLGENGARKVTRKDLFEDFKTWSVENNRGKFYGKHSFLRAFYDRVKCDVKKSDGVWIVEFVINSHK